MKPALIVISLCAALPAWAGAPTCDQRKEHAVILAQIAAEQLRIAFIAQQIRALGGTVPDMPQEQPDAMPPSAPGECE